MPPKETASPPLKVGDRPELLIESLVGGGEALARYEGFTVFVPFAVPGDRIRAKVISTKPTYARALIETVLAPASDRVTPRCPAFTRCGGCQWQGLDYPGQVAWKTRLVADALQRQGGIDPVGVLKPTIASPEPWAYRNKVHWAIARTDKRWEIGLFEPKSHQIADVSHCAIQGDVTNRVLAALREILPQFPYVPYDERTGRGHLRSIFVKVGHQTNELMLGIVTRSELLPEAERFVQVCRDRLPELTTIVQNIHPDTGNKLMGRVDRVLFGPGTIRERIGPLEFAISAQSFFQVNSGTIDALYDAVATAAQLETQPLVIDAYSGTGSIALYLAAKGAREVIGLEIVPQATQDAEANARHNQLADRARFITGPVERELPKLAKAGIQADVIVLDPPRKGCEVEVLQTVAAMGARRLIYVSCNPTTLARDLKILGELGYRTSSVQPVDMFPQTAHVEACAVLDKV